VTRKDGHQLIIFMQCGPVRYKVSDRAQADKRLFEHKVVVWPTSFHLLIYLKNAAAQAIQEVYTLLVCDEVHGFFVTTGSHKLRYLPMDRMFTLLRVLLVPKFRGRCFFKTDIPLMIVLLQGSGYCWPCHSFADK
jgi:hypothetical protein